MEKKISGGGSFPQPSGVPSLRDAFPPSLPLAPSIDESDSS